MEALISIVGLITVGAITPGPNNLVVMQTAARRGFVGALPDIAGIVRLFAFQFLNPKGWILVLTATSSLQTNLGGVAGLFPLAVLFALIPTICLGLWTSLGALMTKQLRGKSVLSWFDRLMGSLLIGFAIPLLLV